MSFVQGFLSAIGHCSAVGHFSRLSSLNSDLPSAEHLQGRHDVGQICQISIETNDLQNASFPVSAMFYFRKSEKNNDFRDRGRLFPSFVSEFARQPDVCIVNRASFGDRGLFDLGTRQ